MKMKNMVLAIMACFLIFISMSCICACDDADMANTRDASEIIVDDAIEDSIDLIDDGASSAADDNMDDSGSSADDSIDVIDDGASSDSDSIDVNDGDSIIKNMTKNVPKYNNEPISNVKDGQSGFKEVQSLINCLPAGSVLYLSEDYTMQNSDSIAITKDIIIDGNGHTLNANKKGTIFKINGGNVVLKNLILTKGLTVGVSESGAAIYVPSASGLRCENIQFIGNSADVYGGAVFINATITSSFINCTFKDNKISVALNGMGGAIKSMGDLNIYNCLFENNQGASSSANNGNGGAIYAAKSLYVSDSTFKSNCVHSGFGGAICSQGDCTIKNSKFDNNYANYHPDWKCNGGAIRCYALLTIESCNFSNNKVDDRGGAIYADGGLILRGDNEFIGQEAHDFGGAIYSKSDVYVNWDDTGKTTFKSNRANTDNGGAIYSEKNVYVKNGVFDSNFAEDNGGAIFTKGNTYVNWNGDGDTIFKYNRANTDEGGSIYSEGNVYVKNADFSYGYAHNGGAIFAEGNTIIDSSVFNVNHASHQGGAIYDQKGLSLRGRTSFAANEAGDSGGAIYTRKFDEDVYHATFRYNVAGDDGGAIYIDHENHETFTECDFEDNYAGDEGGAIYLDDGDSHLSLKRNNLVNNKAKSGATVYNHGVYDDIKDNWHGPVSTHGASSPNFDNQFKKYRLILKDLDITPTSYSQTRISW